MILKGPPLLDWYSMITMVTETTVLCLLFLVIWQKKRFAHLLRVHTALLKADAMLLTKYRILQGCNGNLRELSIRDGLTGLHNRRHFDERLASEWERSTKTKQPLTMLFLDVDYFMLLNDNHGHQYGDECLRKIAMILGLPSSRKEDCVARLGGEEFAVLLPGGDVCGALFIAEVFRRKVLELSMAHPGSPEGLVSISIGVSSRTPSQDDLPDMLVCRADEAMYEAKQSGRNRVCLKEGSVQRTSVCDMSKFVSCSTVNLTAT